MKNKLKLIVTLIAVFCLCVSAMAFTACGDKTPVHEHALYDVEEVPATCVSEGNIAYEHCIYCGQIYIDGKEASEEDIVLPVDPNNHADLVEHAEVPATCVVDGVKAYKECGACGALIDGDGNIVTADDLVIKASGEHDFSGGNTCALCDAYKIEYAAGKSVIVDGLSDIGIVPAVSGGSHVGTTGKEAAIAALIKNKMTTVTQLASATTTSAVYGEDIKLTYTGTSATYNTFTRLCVGDNGKDYVGKFVFAFDLSVNADVAVDRIGAKVVDNTATVIAENASYDKLLGANKSEENNADRKLTPNATYRFVYLMETTAVDQLVQMFVCGGAATWTLSNIHVVLLPNETASGIVTSKMLYFGSTDMSGNVTPAPDPEPEPEPTPEPGESKSYLLADGTDFFKADSWKSADSAETVRTASEICDENGNLRFTSDTASRINMFYVAQAEDGSWKHLGDKKANTDLVPSVYGVEYSYEMTINASGAFDMLVLGASKCYSKEDAGAAGLFLTFTEDGKITVNHCSNNTQNDTYKSWGEFSGTSNFEMNKDNTVTLRITRADDVALLISVEVNGSAVVFEGEDADGKFSVENGAFKSNEFLAEYGMGQRAGFYPSAGNTLTVSSLEFSHK